MQIHSNPILKEKPQTIIRQPAPSIYALLNNNTSEIEKLPVTPTLLMFKDQNLNEKYFEAVFFNIDKHRVPCNEFKVNLAIFSVFYTFYFVSTVIFTIMLYINHSLPIRFMLLKLILIGFNSTLIYISVYLLFRSSFMYRHALKVITLMGCYLILHLTISDSRILSTLTRTNVHIPDQSSFLLTVFIFLLKKLSFCTFRTTLTYAIFASSILSIGLLYSNLNLLNTLYELILFTIILILTCINTYRYEHTSKDIFWKSELKLRNIDTIEDGDIIDNNSEEIINTEVEILLKICERVKKSIKFVSSMMIYKDVKAKLKIASIDLDSLKRRIAGEVFRSSVRLENSHNIDDQDRVFISQMFMQMSLKNNSSLRKFQTIKDIAYTQPTLSFSQFWSNDLNQILKAVGEDWNFDIWLIHQTTSHSIFIISQYIFYKLALCEEFNIDSETFDRFFQLLEKKYHQNPYHNACHAADVLHSFLYFCKHGELFPHLVTLEILSGILACLCHDVGHPAVTNRFLIQNRDDLAIQYNDLSVLENMHAHITFSLMQTPGCNILQTLANEDWQNLRKIVIELILDTDMSRHFEILGRFRARTSNLTDFGLEHFENKVVVLSMAVKCADLGHSAKVNELHERWTALICEEFFRQGDIEKERKQEISMYCDRLNTDIPKSQSGFIKNICLPLYESWNFYLKSEVIRVKCLEQMRVNLEYWVRKGTKVNENGKMENKVV